MSEITERLVSGGFFSVNDLLENVRNSNESNQEEIWKGRREIFKSIKDVKLKSFLFSHKSESVGKHFLAQ